MGAAGLPALTGVVPGAAVASALHVEDAGLAVGRDDVVQSELDWFYFTKLLRQLLEVLEQDLHDPGELVVHLGGLQG